MQFIAKPHDKIFKGSLNNPKVAIDLLQQHLPQDLQSKINFDTLTICNESYIDEDLALHCVDA